MEWSETIVRFLCRRYKVEPYDIRESIVKYGAGTTPLWFIERTPSGVVYIRFSKELRRLKHVSPDLPELAGCCGRYYDDHSKHPAEWWGLAVTGLAAIARSVKPPSKEGPVLGGLTDQPVVRDVAAKPATRRSSATQPIYWFKVLNSVAIKNALSKVDRVLIAGKYSVTGHGINDAGKLLCGRSAQYTRCGDILHHNDCRWCVQVAIAAAVAK